MYGRGEVKEKRHACYNCSEELVFEVKVGRRDMCPNCNAYLHACFNCDHWDASAHNQCRENQGEFIRDRAEGNFCLYFDFRTIKDDKSNDADDAKAKLNALFGAKPGAAPARPAVTGPSPRSEDEARARLERLFKK